MQRTVTGGSGEATLLTDLKTGEPSETNMTNEMLAGIKTATREELEDLTESLIFSEAELKNFLRSIGRLDQYFNYLEDRLNCEE